MSVNDIIAIVEAFFKAILKILGLDKDDATAETTTEA